MTLLVRLCCGVVAVLLCVSLNGCTPSGQSQLDEERNSNFVEGKNCVGSLDYKGAINKFEQALDDNPRSGSAHFQLGMLYEEKEPDPAAAIYHYEQFLKLRPNYENAEVIRQRIANCKQDLAKTALPLPITPELRHQFEQLLDENKRLREELERWKTYYAGRAQMPTNPPGQTPTRPVTVINDPAPTGTAGANPPTGGRSSTSAVRTHTVQAGDSLYSIAKKYGVKLEALMAANPGVDAKRLQPGQTLNLPPP